MKLLREGPREFAEYNYDKILLENAKETYIQHFKDKRNFDVLASEQRPSCMRLDQLPSLNLIFLRFTTSASIQNNDRASQSWTLPHSDEKTKKCLKTKQLRKNLSFPKFYPLSI